MSLDADLKVTKCRKKTIMKRRALVPDRDALGAEIASLSKASIKDLRERWKVLCGKEASGRIGRSFLVRAIAYRLQEEAFGSLKPFAQQILDRVCDGRGEAARKPSPDRQQVRGPC